MNRFFPRSPDPRPRGSYTLHPAMVRAAAIFLFLWFISIPASAQQFSIIPKPLSVEAREGVFRIDAAACIEVGSADPALRAHAEWFAALLRAGSALPLPVFDEGTPPATLSRIHLSLDPGLVQLGGEGYRLAISPSRIDISALRTEGIFHALQSLRQLLPASAERRTGPPSAGWTVPCGVISDAPRFSWRGMHLDVSRHFFPPSFIKKYLDVMALYKLNVFHWHLTDDQGWRIEIRRYPQLTAEASRRKETEGDGIPYGGFYTQEEIREIVEYARRLGITVVPEIDMPGHVRAMLSVFPELSCTGGPFDVATRWGVFDDVLCVGNDNVYAVIRDILAEVAKLFPSPVIHMGGDEASSARWSRCPKCIRRMALQELSDPNRLRSYFSYRVAAIAAALGKRVAGWDEILQGGAPNDATITAWQSEEAGYDAARKGHAVVMSPIAHCYFDQAQATHGEPPAPGLLPIDSVYAFDPAPRTIPDSVARNIAGVQGSLWTEMVPDAETAEYMLLPRLCALSEVGWTPAAIRTNADFISRLKEQYTRLLGMGLNPRIPPPLPTPARVYFARDTLVSLSSIPGGTVRYTTDGHPPDDTSPVAATPLRIAEDKVLTARTWFAEGFTGKEAQTSFFRINPAVNGVRYKYYEGEWTSLPRFESLTPRRTGLCYDLHLDAVPHRQERFALLFDTDLFLDAAGTYTFYLRSNDGSRLEIDRQLVVDNDGAHGAIERSGEIFLSPGWHDLSLGYFDGGGGNILEVYYQYPGSGRQPLPPRLLHKMNGLITGALPGDDPGIRFDQNYPNPFSESTTISLSLDRRRFIRLTLFDLLGRELREIYAGDLEAGRFVVPLSLPYIAPGSYILRLTAEGVSLARPIAIAR